MVDTDQSGKIDYSEWIVATIDKTKLVKDEKLELAYDLFDKNDQGNIRTSDVKDLLCSGQFIEDEVWQKIVKSVDEDGNGEIDF